MIIISSKPGQLGNLLVVYSAFLAFSLDTGVTVCNPAFHQYNRFFTHTRNKTRSSFLYHLSYYFSRILQRLTISNRFISVTALDWEDKVNLDLLPEKFLKSRFHFVQGWQFRANELLRKHADAIRTYFKPVEHYQQRVVPFMQKVRDQGTLVVGIHLRRGDYARFKDGKYYYSDNQYASVAKMISELFAPKKVTFLLASNESIPSTITDGLNYVIAPGDDLLDMYCLAACDYITGPPSTYSMWASFYGKTPLYMIEDPGHKITANDFKIKDNF